jgi:hypothetical protein
MTKDNFETLRRGHADAAKHVVASQGQSRTRWFCFSRNDRMEVARKPERRRQHSERHGPDRATQSGSGAWVSLAHRLPLGTEKRSPHKFMLL